jgi:hypothetical protein
MVKLALIFCLLSNFSTAFAANVLPDGVRRLLGKQGVFFSTVDGKTAGDSGGGCTFMLETRSATQIVIESNTGTKAVANFAGAKRTRAAGEVYLTTYTGKRPGGSVCGDYTPLVSYEKTVSVKINAIEIRQNYRCGFSKTEIVEACRF